MDTQLDLMTESMVEQYADKYYKQYRPQVESFEKHSMQARAGFPVTESDIYGLGRQLERYESYQRFVESRGSLGDLGMIPNVALDVLTAGFGASIIPLIASTQVIPEESGIIYFKQIRATNTGYGRTAGDLISSPLEAPSYSDTYGAYDVNDKVIGTTVPGNVGPYTIVVDEKPLRPYKTELKVIGAYGGTEETRAIDDGRGTLLGNGLTGTVDYASGTYILTFATAPTAAADIRGTYGVNVEIADEIMGISGSHDTTPIKAEIYSLKAETGLLQEYAFQQRFGRMATDEIASDLTNELTRVTNTVAIRRLDLATSIVETWSRTPSGGVSYADHKMTFIDAFANAENKLSAAAGRGNISRLIAGTKASATLRGLPGFVPVDSGSNASIGLYGYYNNVPVIRAANVLLTDDIIAAYKGDSYFQAPLVNAPFMPLFMSNTMTTGSNPLRNQRVAAVWTGLKVVIPNFLVRIRITN